MAQIRRLIAGLVPILCGPLSSGAQVGVSDNATAAAVVASDQLAGFLSTWCLDCHAGPDPEADLRLDAGVSQQSSGAILRLIRKRLIDRDMPPTAPLPDDETYRAAIAATEAMIASASHAPPRVASPPAGPRRLSRVEYANTVRDLLGVGLDVETLLPADEIADGFDNQQGLGIATLLLEKYLVAAEVAAAAAVNDIEGPTAIEARRGADALRGVGGARRDGKRWSIFSNGGAAGDFDAPRRGRYLLSATVAGQQAGPERVRMALRKGSTELASFEVEGDRQPKQIEVELVLPEGRHALGVGFLNDYYNPDDPDPSQRDRNAFVMSVSLRGPLDAPQPTALQRDLSRRTGGVESHRRERAALELLAGRAWRSPPSPEAIDRLVATAGDAAGAEASPSMRLRAAVTALLVSPRFLLRMEGIDALEGDVVRPIDSGRSCDPWRLASDLSYFLWATMPDEALLDAAASGALASSAGRAAQVRRMLDDPRSLALGEHFATQWLQIRSLASRSPDPDRFAGVDAALLEAMRLETVLFFDSVVRERRPIADLLRADDTFLNEALADHYGVPGVRGGQLRRVSLGGLMTPTSRAEAGAGEQATGDLVQAQLGILRHASVLLATSNPTRTSPVKRGKWILEAILDDPPPPPPPDVPALPNDGERRVGRDHHGDTLRAMMERHRADPGCVGCHRRMDAMGFALESFDAVGRARRSEGGGPIDCVAELPDGRTIAGPAGLRDALLDGESFTRSLATHMMIYATGRGRAGVDEATIDAIVAALSGSPTIETLVIEIVERGVVSSTMPATAPEHRP